jgi:hypothetical protein
MIHRGTAIVRFVKEEKAKEGERLLGSSEVIESVFGKFKRLAGTHAKSGITGLLLAVGAMVSETGLKIVKQALESTKTKHVLEWCREKLGKTVQVAWAFTIAPSPLKMVRTLFGSGSVT